MIHIASSIMNVPFSALEIYVSGCTRKCPECQNSQIQDFGIGLTWPEWNERNKKKYSNPLVSRLWILGGDLLCQDKNDIISFVRDIRESGKELWLWTGENIDNILKDSLYSKIALQFDYIKAGSYDKDNKERKIYDIDGEELELAGSNQGLYKVCEDSLITLKCEIR